ncbi:ABC transporter ATP-binding protein [Mesorhizobium amorphae]|uniref:Inner-membrane translocator:ABC transporter related protein n=1 Tax=Mesorhizobium amorphae CCNWGS0123 TaxID=1082933 RepID=G6Y8M3_9HYPH|nr:ABC transporter ATP-binding protein [Mesorhizobium amorphae]ANT52914.1 ABC transporter ATP-binding protein [Mesorhizobium amorphae CCNWGS0123]EHH11925.1 Inner-membrane translocator:ABC transporter related protein [Mesorhizobium amorphae CCNWGS0123]GLR40765.1 ABC transporter ATP-binding protein [Mesorhizobium amorphae]
MSVPLLTINQVRKAFGGLVAVNDVSFEVAKGELLGLIGPNGSGKTTMLNLISGALSPTSGNILLSGQPIAGLPAHKIARIGVARTFQLVRVLPSMSSLENVVAGAVFGHNKVWGDEALTLARDLLERVGLKGREDVPVAAMTYIDQKRIELARALAGNPHILLLDEWLAGLNPSELRIGMELIREISAQGRTIIMVEHVMDAIRSLCQRCVVMNSGVKIADGKSASVLADPEVVRAYLGDEDDA